MTSPNQPAPPRPTLFISYASEDRPAARRLRDALELAGLDVWYDENELAGGDAWDQKIRRQIRDCDFFMPLISASSERRKEGYFRREWRLATERTLDMADDVMFLLPVCLDDTFEGSARVPDRFRSVQWLRATGGEPTAALNALARRLAAGEHVQPAAPRGRTEPPPLLSSAPATSSSTPPLIHDGPPPMPPFPHLAEKHSAGQRFKFFAEVIWWAISGVWILLKRAPRWVRIVVSIWFCITLISYCKSVGSRPERSNDEPKAAHAAPDLQKAAEKLKKSGLPDNLAKLGSQIAGRLAAELKDSEASDKQIVAVPFAAGATNPEDAKFLGEVFTPLWGRLAVERPGNTGLISTPLPAPANDTLLGVGRKLDATYVLGARLVNPGGTDGANGDAAKLEVVLLQVETGSVAWSSTFSRQDIDPAAIAQRIGEGVLATTAK